MHIQLLRPHAFEVQPLQAELAAHPELWDTHRARTQSATSPHREISDIWVRYFPEGRYGSIDEREIEWYPGAEQLPSARAIAQELMRAFHALSLGGVLITRIPAGKCVYPHQDEGWHARTFEKFAVQVRANAKQAFHFEEESLVTEDGDLFTFENAFPHWVTNDSDEERITLIVCLRRH